MCKQGYLMSGQSWDVRSVVERWAVAMNLFGPGQELQPWPLRFVCNGREELWMGVIQLIQVVIRVG